MSGAKRVGRYPDEMRERAVRMVFDHQHEYPSQWKAIESISKKLSINHETLRIWVRRAETDAGERPGVTTDERARMRELESCLTDGVVTPFHSMAQHIDVEVDTGVDVRHTNGDRIDFAQDSRAAHRPSLAAGS